MSESQRSSGSESFNSISPRLRQVAGDSADSKSKYIEPSSSSADATSVHASSCDAETGDSWKANPILKRLLSFKQIYSKNKTMRQLNRQVDEIRRKNNDVVAKLRQQIKMLDVDSVPTSGLPADYRWMTLIRNLNGLSVRLEHLMHLMQHDRVQTAMNMFTFDIWPLTLKIACNHEVETGLQGDWIKDITALFVFCEKYAAEAELAGRVRDLEKRESVPLLQVKKLLSAAPVLEFEEELQDDRNTDKRAS